MHSPPKEHIPAHGLSHSKGGILWGHAVGNASNIADLGQALGDYDLDGAPTKGKIYLYISDLDPSAVDVSQSSFIATVYDTAKCQTVQEIMKRGSREYSPIHSKLFAFYFICLLD